MKILLTQKILKATVILKHKPKISYFYLIKRNANINTNTITSTFSYKIFFLTESILLREFLYILYRYPTTKPAHKAAIHDTFVRNSRGSSPVCSVRTVCPGPPGSLARVIRVR